ncbi:hypothetical protein [Yinghuangia soli]|uniref:Uncharacterized protein n=1 Tax=Yinghuangia soli TaxID=2908204 RepID=A0AA41Q604_9ACTN|nr:hypothetical protein [Yinghuangia soli]MCF2531291.1 hypothetical protein [Yinghuangia soli]
MEHQPHTRGIVVARVYQAVLHGSAEHLGRALRRSFAAAYQLPDDGTAELEHTSAERHIVLRDADTCGRYICDSGRVRVTAIWGPASISESAWALIAVDAPTPDAPHAAFAAEIVSGFLEAERAFDGTIPLETGPFAVDDADHVGELLRRLLDPRRRVPVVVLSVDDRRPELPARHAAHLARRTAGTAVVAVLGDPEAEERLNGALGEGFKVYGGALRTYLAEFDPATEDYPLRHPVRSGAALRDLGRRALDVVVAGVTGDGVRRALPLDVRRGLRLVPQVLERGIPWEQAAVLPVGAAPRPCAPGAGAGTARSSSGTTGRSGGRPAGHPIQMPTPAAAASPPAGGTGPRPGESTDSGTASATGVRNPLPAPRREQSPGAPATADVPGSRAATPGAEPGTGCAAGPAAGVRTEQSPATAGTRHEETDSAADPPQVPRSDAAPASPSASGSSPAPGPAPSANPGTGADPGTGSGAGSGSGTGADPKVAAGSAGHSSVPSPASPQGSPQGNAPGTPGGSPSAAPGAGRGGLPSPLSVPPRPPGRAAGAPAAPPQPATPAELSGEIAAMVVAALQGAGPGRLVAVPREAGDLVGQLRGLVDKLDRESRSAGEESEAEHLAAQLARLRDDYDLLVLQYEELAEESRRSEDRIRRLDGLLAELSAGADAVPAYDVWIPECLADVLRRARTELPHVSLPDSLDSGAATLDKAEPGLTRVWAAAAWDALRALNAYAQARSANTFRGGFRDWCRNPPHGAYALSPKKFAMKESDAVAGRAKFRKARTFPVPPEVAPEQVVFMEAHVKLRGIGNPAPRMHFHDDAAGATGRIHVGYLGHHLDNTRTN